VDVDLPGDKKNTSVPVRKELFYFTEVEPRRQSRTTLPRHNNDPTIVVPFNVSVRKHIELVVVGCERFAPVMSRRPSVKIRAGSSASLPSAIITKREAGREHLIAHTRHSPISV
jgi:hypothetical protein